MSNWAVFLAATRASRKALNRTLVLLQDFEYSEYPVDSSWKLITSKELPAGPFAATALPVPEIARNAFAGMSLAEINTFGADLSAGNWFIVDQKGLETSTCLVCDQYHDSGEEDGDEDEDKEGIKDMFRACRIPYEEANSMMVNLDIANMGFEDFVDKDARVQKEGSWKWAASIPDAEETESTEPTDAEVKKRRH
ncbi:hypothetical protein B0H17DRAFT_1195183 [Mycena rosella]|uniref:DUF6924 domain-containing protein n=1 Tax=Mycena rosella TaxID=1033263 RepID=A0AAD7DXR0_MYCRO|nr:hypothetical protein B0H17DRAFT_1195183 [Mycena rosella]